VPLRDRFQLLFRRRHLYRSVYGTPEGHVVLQDLMRFCGVRNEQYTPGSFEDTAYALGKKRVGLRIASILHLSDDELMKLADQPEEAEHGNE
jgi:hypothetical protein